jgi:hypothetical protein
MKEIISTLLIIALAVALNLATRPRESRAPVPLRRDPGTIALILLAIALVVWMCLSREP